MGLKRALPDVNLSLIYSHMHFSIFNVFPK